MKAYSADKGKHTPRKATAALPQAVIPNEARPRSFDEQMDAYVAVSEGRVAAGAPAMSAANMSGTRVAMMPSIPIASSDSFLMPTIPVASGDSFLTDATPQNFGSNVVAALDGQDASEDDGALPQAVIPLPYLTTG